MGGGRGCDLLRQARNLAPGTPVAALTGDDGPTARIDCGRTVPTLRRSDGDVELLVRVHRLMDAARGAVDLASETVLAIGAHPDDVEIGVAGALTGARISGPWRQHPDPEPWRRRGGHRPPGGRVPDGGIAARRPPLHGGPGGHPPPVGSPDRRAHRAGGRPRPADHRLHALASTTPTRTTGPSHEATMVAARRVARISCYQSPSATVDFRPNRFVPIADFVDAKQQAIDALRHAVRPRLPPVRSGDRHRPVLGPLRPRHPRRSARGRARQHGPGRGRGRPSTHRPGACRPTPRGHRCRQLTPSTPSASS